MTMYGLPRGAASSHFLVPGWSSSRLCSNSGLVGLLYSVLALVGREQHPEVCTLAEAWLPVAPM
jgi:hypothetical protein